MPGKECCKISAVVNLDPKGQIVLPKELREKANLKPNDKLALVALEKEGNVCCIVMLKADALENQVKCMLQPVFKEVLKGEKT